MNLEYEEQKNHGKNINSFRQHYIKTNKLDIRLSDYIGKLYKYRDIGDYDLDFVPEHEIVAEMVKNARTFVEAVHKYLNENYFSKEVGLNGDSERGGDV